MSALATSLAGVVHRPVDPRARRQPAHDRVLPRHDPAAAHLRIPETRCRAVKPRSRAARCAANRHVPRPPRDRPRVRRPDPQHPPGRDPHLLPLLHAASPRTRCDDRAGPADRAQTPRTRARHLSHRARARRADRRPRPLELDRSPRPRDHHPARPDRTASLRADRSSLRRRSPRLRRARRRRQARAASRGSPL